MKEKDSDVMIIELIRKNDDYSDEELEKEDNVEGEEELGVEYFDKFPTRSELAYHKEDPKSLREISNFTGRIRGMHIFVGNFTYVSNLLIVEDISSVIDPYLSQVVLEKPFVQLSNMTYDSSLGIVKFTNRADEIAYMIPHKIKQFKSLSNMEKQHTQSVYFKNEEDKRRGVDYVMSKILGLYKECLELRPEYLTRLEVIFDEESPEVLWIFTWTILG
ncbi:hypothetical protein Tco_0753758 [Tanacetum coccineum]